MFVTWQNTQGSTPVVDESNEKITSIIAGRNGCPVLMNDVSLAQRLIDKDIYTPHILQF